MISDLTICTVYFPIVNHIYPKFDINTTHLEEGSACFGHVTCIHSQTLDLPMTEFRQPLQVQSHLEMPGILVQLGHTQRT